MKLEHCHLVVGFTIKFKSRTEAGGLCGAALAAASGDWSVIKWNEGVWPKVVLPMIASPIAGFVFGALFMFLLLLALHRFTPHFGAVAVWKAADLQRGLDGP